MAEAQNREALGALNAVAAIVLPARSASEVLGVHVGVPRGAPVLTEPLAVPSVIDSTLVLAIHEIDDLLAAAPLKVRVLFT